MAISENVKKKYIYIYIFKICMRDRLKTYNKYASDYLKKNYSKT